MRTKGRLFLGAAVMVLWSGIGAELWADPMGTAFTFQGQLKQDGQPVSGATALRFSLFDAPVEGSLVVEPLVFDGAVGGLPLVQVTNGLFTVELDFGPAFSGDARWLEVAVQSAAGTGYTVLSPRQPVTAAPYALHVRGLNLDESGGLQVSGDIQTSGVVKASGYDSNSPNKQLVGGVECARFADGPNNHCYFGIGETNPLARLHIGGMSGVDGLMFPDGTLQTTAAAADVSGFWTDNGNDISNTNSGNVGIGLTAPLHPLHVAGNSNNSAIFSAGTLQAFKDINEPGPGLMVTRKVLFPSVHHFWTTIDGNEIDGYGNPPGLNGLNLNGTSGGNVGIHNSSPSRPLHIGSVDTPGSEGLIRLEARHDTALAASKWEIGVTQASGAPVRDSFIIDDPDSGLGPELVIRGTGLVGIGKAQPLHLLHLLGGALLGKPAAIMIEDNHLNPAYLFFKRAGQPAENYIALGANNDMFFKVDGVDQMIVKSAGRVWVRVLEIAGADVAEKFPVSEEMNPGMVAEIDPDNPGKLRIARSAYNRRVAGVVSGANGLPTGTILGNLPGSENAPPIALSGRVWVYCDATENAIEPGDLLTTSDTAGHAMKVVDYPRAQGAILGKAMSQLDGGKALVLVLVTLQ